MKSILWITALATCGLYISGQIVDPDLWWHITIGRWILAHLTWPESDYWTMFAYGEPWRAYSWLFEIIVAPVDALFGIEGLWLLKLSFAVLLAITLGFVFSKLSKNYFIGALLGIVTTSSCFNHFTLRPQSIVWILFAYLLYLSSEIGRHGITKSAVLRVGAVLCVWANIHITTLLGLIVLFLWVYGSRGTAVAIKITTVGFIATLFTPYVGGEWLTFFSTSSHPFHFASVAEFQPANILQHSTAFLLILLSLVLLLVQQDPKKIELSKHVIWIGFTVAGLAVVKFLPFACISLAAVIAYAIGNTEGGTKGLGNFGEGINRFANLVSRIPKEGLTFVVICWFIVLFVEVWREPLNRRITPIEIFDIIQKNDLAAPILVGFGAGGYMMYRFSDNNGEITDPLKRVPIDGRTNLISANLWEKFQSSFEGKEGWQAFVDLVKPKTIVWKNQSPLISLLLTTKKWCRVFKSGSEAKDGYSLLVLREIAYQKKEEFPESQCYD